MRSRTLGYASLVVVGLAACLAVYTHDAAKSGSAFLQVEEGQYDEYLRYIAKYGKSYISMEEFEMRVELFKSAMMSISDQNSKNDNSFYLAPNKFADWTREEYRQLLGLRNRNFTSE